jgi:hypothetical protein
MIDVFLSASIPLPERNRQFFETADVLLIREAVKALVEVVLPVGRLTTGGHPAITPLLSLFAREAGLGTDRLTIFQSSFFAHVLPTANDAFADVRIVPAVQGNRTQSLTAMRRTMISSRTFHAAVIVGGMDGIFEEVSLFAELQPAATILPIASTGAAAALVHQRGNYDQELATNLTFASLFRRELQPL